MSFKRLITAVTLALASVPAMANSISSDACAPGERDFTVTANTVLSCLAAGDGNINGNNAADASLIAAGWVMIDASDNGDGAHDGWLSGGLTGGTSGQFGIDAGAYSTYERIAIGFKSGFAQITPTWAIFELANGTLGGDWTISGQQALSHAILYGFGTPQEQPGGEGPGNGGPGTSVPEPGMLALAGLGLLAVGAARRRKQA